VEQKQKLCSFLPKPNLPLRQSLRLASVHSCPIPHVVEPKYDNMDDEDSVETKTNDDEYAPTASLLLTFMCPKSMN
jgi:hypothetical protein